IDGKPGPWDPIIGDINVGLLWILSISSLAVYGIVLGGWASGNRYSLLGSLRSAAQMVSYETSLGLALSGTLMWAGTLSMVGIIHAQLNQGIWFIAAQPLGFFLYLIAGIAEVNRAPFDLPEAEQELTAGYLTEYSRLGWQLLLPLAVLNVVITATVVALDWPWWVSGIAGLLIILAVLFYERRKIAEQQKEVIVVEQKGEKKVMIPSSVRLAKFEKVGTE